MASYLEGLFADYVDPQLLRMKQQQQFTQNLTQSTDPRQFMATVGANMGQQLSQGVQGMFGGPSNQEKLGQVLRNAQGATQAERMQSIAEQLSRMPGMERQAMAAAAEAARLKSAEFDANNKIRTVYRTVKKPVLDKIEGKPTGEFYETSISVTEYYNPRTGQWEERGGSAGGAGAGGGVTTGQATDAIRKVNEGNGYDPNKAKEVLEQRGGGYPVPPPKDGAVNRISGNGNVVGRPLGPVGLPDQQLATGNIGVPSNMNTVEGPAANARAGVELDMLLAERGRAITRGDRREAERLTNEIEKIRESQRKFR